MNINNYKLNEQKQRHINVINSVAPTDNLSKYLPIELIFRVLSGLSTKDLQNMSCTSLYYMYLIDDSYIWSNLMKKYKIAVPICSGNGLIWNGWKYRSESMGCKQLIINKQKEIQYNRNKAYTKKINYVTKNIGKMYYDLLTINKNKKLDWEKISYFMNLVQTFTQKKVLNGEMYVKCIEKYDSIIKKQIF